MSDKTTINGEVVEVVRTTKHNAEAKGHELTWSLNFENVTHEQLLELATRSVVIGIQRTFRTEKGKPEDWNNRDFDVAEELSRSKQRAKVDPKEAARRLLAGMTEEERDEFLTQI